MSRFSVQNSALSNFVKGGRNIHTNMTGTAGFLAPKSLTSISITEEERPPMILSALSLLKNTASDQSTKVIIIFDRERVYYWRG